MSVFFTEEPVRDYAAAKAATTWRFPPFFHALLDRGVYAPPSAFEAWFVNAAMDDAAFDVIAAALPAAAAAAAAAPRRSRDHPHDRAPGAPRRGGRTRRASCTAGCPASGCPSWASGRR